MFKVIANPASGGAQQSQYFHVVRGCFARNDKVGFVKVLKKVFLRPIPI
jgi:hypothetical protein